MKKNYVPAVISTILMIILLAFPERYIPVCVRALAMYGGAVLPALLPFFFLSAILTESGAAADNFLSRVATKLFGSKPEGGFIFAMSLISGYPMGAKLIGDFYSRGTLSSADSENISAYASTSGPMFVIGTVGTILLNDKTAGFILYFSHAVAAIINGLFYRIKAQKSFPAVFQNNSNTKILSTACTSASRSILTVGIYVVLFYLFAQIVDDFILTPIVGTDESQVLRGTLLGIIEVTRGAQLLAPLGHSVLPLIAALISFGGISVALQSITFFDGAVRTARFFIMKLTQATCAYFICSLVCLFV